VRTWNPDEEVDLAIGESGIEAEEPINVGQLFKNTLKEFSTHVALKYKESGKWKAITYSEYYNHCIRAAKSFLKVRMHVSCIYCIAEKFPWCKISRKSVQTFQKTFSRFLSSRNVRDALTTPLLVREPGNEAIDGHV